MLQPQLQIYTLFSFVAVILSAVTFGIYTYFNPKKKVSTLMLNLALLCISIGIFTNFLLLSRLIIKVPHLYRVGRIILYMFMPFSYLYVRKLLFHENWKKTDYLHFIPALLFVVDYIPFFALSGAEKISYFEKSFATESLDTMTEGWLFPNYSHLIGRLIQGCVYSVLMIWTFYRSHISSDQHFRRTNSGILLFIKLFIGMMTVNAFLPAVLLALVSSPPHFTNAFGIAMVIFVSIILIANPSVLYGFKGLIVEVPHGAPDLDVPRKETLDHTIVTSDSEDATLPEESSDDRKTRKSYITEDQVRIIETTLMDYMENHKPFLSQKYNIQQMSADTGYQLYLLSAFLNQYMGMNFNTYVNTSRIKYLLTEYDKEKAKWDRMTLEGVGFQIGFSNRTSFIQAFKKVTGVTPSVYLKQQDQSDFLSAQ